jgi:hypothetical protein
MSEVNENAQEMAQAAIKRERFSFADAVQDRGYPEVDVPIYLDEAAAHEYVSLQRERAPLEAKMIAASAQKRETEATRVAEELAKIEERIDAIREELVKSQITVKIKGVAPWRMDALQKDAFEKFPQEYTETVSPITGAKTKEEVPCPERELYFANCVRHAHIVSVTAPDGAVDDNFTVEDIAGIWSHLPIVARVKIEDALNDTVVATDYYAELVNPVF